MQISNAEWQVMKIIWMKETMTSTNLISVLAERFSWSKSTVQTLLMRLVEKGYLTREKVGKAFHYQTVLSQSEGTQLMVKAVKDKICSRQIGLFLKELVKESDFTFLELEDLQAVLEGKKAQAVEKVTCNCL